MASNDMNSWDEDPDELLRRRWQQTFAGFEVRPRPSLSQRILGPLTARPRRRPIRWLLAGLLLLLSAGFIYQLRLAGHSNPEHNPAPTGRYFRPVQPLGATRVRQPGGRSGQAIPPAPLVSPPPGETIAGRQQWVNSMYGAETYGVDALSGHRTPLRRLPTGQIRTRREVEGITLPDGPRLSASVRSGGVRPPRPSAGLADPPDYEPASALAERLVRQRHQPAAVSVESVDKPVTSAVPVFRWARLKPMGMVPLLIRLGSLPGQLPALDLAPVPLVKTLVARRRLRWFIDAIPLSSFQWMSAPPTSQAYLSQVRVPGAFSAATWGYQLNGGIRWQRWQAYLSMGQLRRWAYYTVSENRYRVEPSPTDPNQLVRETYAVAESVALPMVGAGLSRQMLLARGGYTAEWGGQVLYLPTSNQALLGLRGGVRQRLALGRRSELQVGLTVEYGLNRLLSEQHQLVIHPLVVGVGLRIQPRLASE